DNKNILHVAWVGDSRLVVERNEKVGFATQDHKPDRLDEKKRIENAGGKVVMHGVPRVNGLAVSRSIGDRKLKNNGHSKCIIAIPEYIQYQLTSDNLFAIIASDGFWDVISNEEVVQLVINITNESSDDSEIVHKLKNEAIRRGS